MPGARRGVAYRASSGVILDFANVRSRALLAPRDRFVQAMFPTQWILQRPLSKATASNTERRLRASQENNITHTKRTRPNQEREKKKKKKKKGSYTRIRLP